MSDFGLEQKRHVTVKEGVIMGEVEQYWNRFAQQHQLVLNTPDSWMFGDGTEQMGNELGELVVKGIKTGTCSSLQSMNWNMKVIPKLDNTILFWTGKIVR